ncbi:MAG: hypothetical protein KDN20_22170 [Verrucomicrobiae bacterium]|nr:hypothetical protein [Verrucomicrobiae bacterium]
MKPPDHSITISFGSKLTGGNAIFMDRSTRDLISQVRHIKTEVLPGWCFC